MNVIKLTNNRAYFKCPGCNYLHYVAILCEPPVWSWNGSLDKPTFYPSILVNSYYDPPATRDNLNVKNQTRIDTVCHSFVRDGQIQFLTDCTHKLVGQTVDLPEFNLEIPNVPFLEIKRKAHKSES